MLSSTPVLCELSQTGLIRFSGEDAQSFLHNLLTCDVGALAQRRSTYGGFCTPKGRLLATFLLWRSGADTLMQLPSPLRDPVQKKLSMFILRAKVKASDASNDSVRFGLAGGAAELLKQAFGQAPRAPHDVLEVEGATLIRLPGDRCEIIVARDKAPAVREALSKGAKTADPDYWDWLDIRAGVPSILPATQEAFVPQMVNLDAIGGVSFEKGCYPGQEIVARMHYRGTLKQRMALANIAGTESRPQPGDKLYSAAFGEQACGTIVNAARAPEGGNDVLAVIQIAASERGEVRWKSPEGPVLKPQPLPYSINLDN